MSDGLDHLSRKTRERAFILARNAKGLGMPLGSVRFTPSYDYMSYWLTNGSDYVIIFCTPDGYLAELWYDREGKVENTFCAVKNIRHFLQYIKREGYQDVDVIFDSIETEGEQDLRSFLEDLDDGLDED